MAMFRYSDVGCENGIMPNTLVHLGVQTLVTRTASHNADVKWIALGCIVPDLPWIMRRVVRGLPIDIPQHELMLYSTVQSTLLMSLVLCGALAFMSSRPRSVFLLLSANALMHLLLDALQIKLGNGVHFFAPFSWELINFGLFWTDSLTTIALTLFGICYIGFVLIRRPGAPIDLKFRPPVRWLGFALLLGVYLLAPLTMLSGPLAEDNNSVRTLRNVDQRPGRSFTFDRNLFIKDQHGTRIVTNVGEELFIAGATIDAAHTISGRGRFIDEKTIELESVRVHRPYFRDGASAIGLLIVVALWIAAIRRQIVNSRQSS